MTFLPNGVPLSLCPESPRCRSRDNSGLTMRRDLTGSGKAANFDRPRLSAALTPPTVVLTSSAIASSV
jgi:hypothetical protein